MSQFRPLTAAILAITLSCAASTCPAQAGGGRGGGGGFGGGGAPYSGGGGMRAGGGPDFDAGVPRFSGGARADGGPRYDADMRGGGADLGGRHFAGDGGRYFSSRFAGPRFAGRAFSYGGDRTRLSTNGGSRKDRKSTRLNSSHRCISYG